MSQQSQTRQPQQRRTGTQQLQSGMQQGGRLSDVQSPQENQALEAIHQAIEVCEWCADRCIQEANPDMVECIRLCEDVSELGETALALVPRNSRQASTVLSAFQQAARQCGQECSRHSRGHCQECAEVLDQAVSATNQLLQGGQQIAGQGGGQQTGLQGIGSAQGSMQGSGTQQFGG